MKRWLPRLILFAILLAVFGTSQPTLTIPLEAVQRGAYPTALSAHPDDLAVLERWLQTSIAAHQTEEAVTLLRHLIDLDGWTAERRRQYADLIAESDPAQAIVYRRTLLDGSARDIALLRQIIIFDLSTRDWADAAAMLTGLVALDPSDATALYQLALLTAPNDSNVALSLLGRAAADSALHNRALTASRIISTHANDPASVQITQLGLQLVADGQWAFAEYLLNRAMALDNNSPVVMALLGVAQDQQGRDGWPLIAQASARVPDDPTVNYAAALHWRLRGDLDAALAILQRAEARDPTNPAIAAEIASVYRQRGSLSDATLWFNLVARLAPQDAGFQQMVIAFYLDENYRLETDGLAMAQKAAQTFPNDAEIVASFGQVLLVLGRTADAHTELERALTLDPSNLRARFAFGQVMEQQGDSDSAQAAYLYVYQNAPVGTLREKAWRSLERIGYRS